MGNKIAEERSYYVAKANDLIRKTRYNLTNQQQKILLYAISKIKPDDTWQTEYEISIPTLCEVCGLKYKNDSYYYVSIKEDIRELTHREWCMMPDGTQCTISWIGDAKIKPGCSTIKIRFHPEMQPYLFELKNCYTQYKLENVLTFKKKYTIRLYEIMKSYITDKMLKADRESDVVWQLDDLREAMQVTGYPSWANFDRFVLKDAVDEINSCTDDIHVDYYPQKTGKKVTSICFTISAASGLQMLTARQERRKRLK